MPSVPKPRKKPRSISRRNALNARNADKYELYEKSVQDPDFEVRFIEQAFSQVGRRPLTLREDFCGSALLCARWVESAPDRQATGVDLDPEVLAWGEHHNLQPLGDKRRRVRLLEQDVREPLRQRHDVIVALNFSYWIMKTRDSLRDYFARARRGLAEGGLFILDAYGGWEASEPMLEPRRVKGGFTYVWDQDGFDPISHDVLNHIHFEFPDGSRIDRAFSYDWRFWSLPELRELLLEAGFASVEIYWDDTADDEEAKYLPRRHVGNQPGWVAYIVASPRIPARKAAAKKRLAQRRSPKN